MTETQHPLYSYLTRPPLSLDPRTAIKFLALTFCRSRTQNPSSDPLAALAGISFPPHPGPSPSNDTVRG